MCVYTCIYGIMYSIKKMKVGFYTLSWKEVKIKLWIKKAKLLNSMYGMVLILGVKKGKSERERGRGEEERIGHKPVHPSLHSNLYASPSLIDCPQSSPSSCLTFLPSTHHIIFYIYLLPPMLSASPWGKGPRWFCPPPYSQQLEQSPGHSSRPSGNRFWINE